MFMSESANSIRIQRHIEDGKGRIVWTVSPTFLNTMLAQHGINMPDELPENYLRELCRRSSLIEMQKEFERIEEENPGRTAIVIGQDSTGNDALVHSSDVGSELIKNFFDDANVETDLLCDPQYSRVDFELRVHDTSTKMAVNPQQNLGSCVLRVTLQPPDLA